MPRIKVQADGRAVVAVGDVFRRQRAGDGGRLVPVVPLVPWGDPVEAAHWRGRAAAAQRVVRSPQSPHRARGLCRALCACRRLGRRFPHPLLLRLSPAACLKAPLIWLPPTLMLLEAAFEAHICKEAAFEAHICNFNAITSDVFRAGWRRNTESVGHRGKG